MLTLYPGGRHKQSMTTTTTVNNVISSADQHYSQSSNGGEGNGNGGTGGSGSSSKREAHTVLEPDMGTFERNTRSVNVATQEHQRDSISPPQPHPILLTTAGNDNASEHPHHATHQHAGHPLNVIDGVHSFRHGPESTMEEDHFRQPSSGPDADVRSPVDSSPTGHHPLPYLGVNGPSAGHGLSGNGMSFSTTTSNSEEHCLQQPSHTQSHAAHQHLQQQSHGQQAQGHLTHHSTSALAPNNAQSAPPTVTSFSGIHSPITSPPPYPSYNQSAYYAPSTASFGQSFMHQQQLQQQAYSQSVNATHGSQQLQQHANSINTAAAGGNSFHAYFSPPSFGLLASSGAGGLGGDAMRSPPPPPTPTSGQQLPMSSMPQHYYPTALSSPTDDFRRMHSAASQAPRSATSPSYQPYCVPSQFHRQGPPPQLLSGTSIFTTNPDTLPDLRFSDAPLSATAQYGRLPDGKIIELYPAMMRTIQACEYCRSRKAKCTGGMPCERCQKKSVKCEYAQLDKKRKVKTTTSQYDLSSGAGASQGSGRTGVAEHGGGGGVGARAQAILNAKAGLQTLKNEPNSDINTSSGGGKFDGGKGSKMQLRSSARSAAAGGMGPRRTRNPGLQVSLDVHSHPPQHPPGAPSSSFDSIAQWQALVTPPLNMPSAFSSSESSDRGSPAIHPHLMHAANVYRESGHYAAAGTHAAPPASPFEADSRCHSRSQGGVPTAYDEDGVGSSFDHKYDMYT